MNKNFIYITLFLLTSLFSFTGKIFAVTTSISNIPQTISADTFTISVTISGASSGTNYLRIDLYKPSTSDYFAETFNGSHWYGDSDHNQYYPVNIQSGIVWSGEIQGRIGNPTLTQYDEPGTYKLRVRRYTSSGNYNSPEANNGAVDVNVDVLLLTPTPSPAPTETLQPTDNIEQSISPTSNLQPQTYNNVYLSEVMIDPDTGSNEWVEIYNDNQFEASLDKWYIDDVENSGTTPKQLSLIIPVKGYISYDLSSSMFNNDGDSVRLLDFNQKEIDSFQYQSSEKGKTLGRTSFDNDSFCLQTPTKNNPNSSCLNPTSVTPKSTSTTTPINTLIKTPTTTGVIINTRSTITPFKFSLLNQNQTPISDSLEEIDNEVLGVSIENQPSKNSRAQALLSSLTFASFSYSALSIISILIKLKLNS